jgi:hypothetical protein
MLHNDGLFQTVNLRQNKKETSFPIRIQLKNNKSQKNHGKDTNFQSLNTPKNSHKKHKSVSFNTTLRTNIPNTLEETNESKGMVVSFSLVSTLQDLIKEIKSDGFEKLENVLIQSNRKFMKKKRLKRKLRKG